MRWTAICAALALIPASAGAEEPAVQLKQAPGVDVVAGQWDCSRNAARMNK